MKKKLNLQLGTAVFLVLAGVVLLYCGFWVVPTGRIDNSVLVAFGELSTFAGALFGVDYSYKFKEYLKGIEKENKNQEEKKE